MNVRFGAGMHAGPFWVSASHAVKRRRGNVIPPAAWSLWTTAGVLVTTVHASWATSLATALVVASFACILRGPGPRPRGSHRQ
jgi:hypothetical protein